MAPSITLTSELKVEEAIDPALSYMIAEPNTLIADGNTQTTVIVFVRDTSNMPIENSNVSFNGLNPNDVMMSSSVNVTDSNGVVRIQISSMQAHTETIMAQLEQNT